MALITVAGPFDETAARETANALGTTNHSVYARAVVDEDGYDTEERQWFVERDTNAVPQRILGYEWSEIQRLQQRK